MKKFLALLVAMILVLASLTTAFATGSKTTNDMNTATTTTGAATTDEEPTYTVMSRNPERLAVVNEELEKLAEAESVAEYFGDAEAIEAILGEGEYNVFEMWPLDLYNYEEADGEVTLNFTFATPYAAGTTVAVLIGIVAEDGTIEWTAFEGTALYNGSIRVTFDAETAAKIANGNALIAVVSK